MVLPMIDLSKFTDAQEYNKLRKASEEWGCFMLVNHNIPMSLMSEMKIVARSLLDLPIEIKKKNAPAVASSGYVAPTKSSPVHEALGLFDFGSAQDVHTFCSQLYASSDQSNREYSAAVHEQIMAIGSKLVESYGLDSGFLKAWHCFIRIIKYNIIPDLVGACGIPSHSDSGFVTILQADENVGGLEMMDMSGVFVPVQPSPGTLLVFFGDSAKAWSNGRVCNVKHRVQFKEATVRLFIASFIWGPKEEVVEAPFKLVDSDHPRLYVPFSFEEFRKLRLNSTNYGNDALEVMRIESVAD